DVAEDDVDPVIRRVEVAVGEGVAGAEDAVGADGVGEGVQHPGVDARGEVPAVVGVVARGGVVGGDVGGVDLDRHRVGEVDLLPAGGRLAGEGGARQQRPGGGPKVRDVRAGVRRPLVEADPRDVAGHV